MMTYDLTLQDLASLYKGYAVRADFCEGFAKRHGAKAHQELADEHRAAAARWEAILEAAEQALAARTDELLAEFA
jgi:hypothetical protein